MARLAEYLADLSVLLGCQDKVHFVRLQGGSTTLIHAVEKEAVPKVEKRIAALESEGETPQDLTRAYLAIDAKLRQDNASGELKGPTGQKVVSFPGAQRVLPPAFGPFNEEGHVGGIVIMIGGKNDPVPVHIEEAGTVHNCCAARELARQLGTCLFGPPIQASGVGRWRRDESGFWEMTRFTIRSFERIDADSLSQAVTRMRRIDSPFKSMEDPIQESLRLRRGPEKVN